MGNLELVCFFQKYKYLKNKGNGDYCACINATVAGFYRLTNIDDIIISLPLSVCPNLSDHSILYFYDHEGKGMAYQSNWESLQLNHSIVNYLSYVNSL